MQDRTHSSVAMTTTSLLPPCFQFYVDNRTAAMRTSVLLWATFSSNGSPPYFFQSDSFLIRTFPPFTRSATAAVCWFRQNPLFLRLLMLNDSVTLIVLRSLGSFPGRSLIAACSPPFLRFLHTTPPLSFCSFSFSFVFRSGHSSLLILQSKLAIIYNFYSGHVHLSRHEQRSTNAHVTLIDG